MSARNRQARRTKRAERKINPADASFFDFEIKDLQNYFELEEDQVDFSKLLTPPEMEAINRTGNLRLGFE